MADALAASGLTVASFDAADAAWRHHAVSRGKVWGGAARARWEASSLGRAFLRVRALREGRGDNVLGPNNSLALSSNEASAEHMIYVCYLSEAFAYVREHLGPVAEGEMRELASPKSLTSDRWQHAYHPRFQRDDGGWTDTAPDTDSEGAIDRALGFK